jgi:8-oxo-dGTP diphosphatase
MKKLTNFSTPLLVSAVALIDRSGHILLQRRPEKGVHGGLWEFPGGKIEPGESPEAAAIREIFEELGLILAETDLVPLTFAGGAAAQGTGGGALVILLYTCRVWSGLPQSHSADALGWFAPDAIASLAMPPLDYPLAAALARSLGQAR